MNEDYAMNWLVKNYGDEIATWPLGMVKKCAEIMKVYADHVSEIKLRDAEKNAAEANYRAGLLQRIGGSMTIYVVQYQDSDGNWLNTEYFSPSQTLAESQVCFFATHFLGTAYRLQ